MTPSLDYVALLPELTLAGVIVAVLVADLVLGDGKKHWLAPLATVLTLIPLGCVIALAATNTNASMIEGTYVVDDFALVAKGFFLASAALVFLMGSTRSWKGEYFTLVLAAVLGMVMLPSSRDLITFFVAFELLAIPGYLLAGWRKNSAHGHESALKYYLLGVLATAVMLYGLSLLFGIAGSTRFADIAVSLETDELRVLGRIAVLFVLIGMAFKVAAVPFHFWAPDVYQGAPLPVAAFLAVISKAAGVVAFALVIGALFPSVDEIWAPFLWAVAAVTMTVGNLVALRQSDIVRLLAWSSIAQAGFLLVPLAVVGRYGGTLDNGIEAVIDYLIFYAIATFAAFAIVILVARKCGSTQITAFRGLFSDRPGVAIAMAVALLSLAGIPPLGGWFAKFMVFNAAIEAHTVAAFVLAVVAALNTVISLVYYALVTRTMWLAPEIPTEGSTSHPSVGLRLLVVGMPIFVVVTGVLPGLVTFFGSSSSLGT